MVREHRKRVFLVSPGSGLMSALGIMAIRHRAEIRRFPGQGDCLRSLARTPCDVLIVDLDEPAEMLDILSQARRLWPWQARIALIAKGEVSQAVEAMKAGAIECLEHPVRQECLLSAIERGLRRTAALFTPTAALTPVEATIVQLVLAGRTSKEIGAQLKRSKRTIEVHRRDICRKLGVCGPIGLVKWAISAGTLDWQENGQAGYGEGPSPADTHEP